LALRLKKTKPRDTARHRQVAFHLRAGLGRPVFITALTPAAFTIFVGFHLAA
jgi:hypothetical protein